MFYEINIGWTHVPSKLTCVGTCFSLWVTYIVHVKEHMTSGCEAMNSILKKNSLNKVYATSFMDGFFYIMAKGIETHYSC